MNMRIGHVPIEVNPKTRESRLIRSMPRYVWRSSSIILRSYVTYKPLRTFLYCSLVPALAGIVIWIRFLYFYFTEGSSGHIQSLILGAILLLISFLLLVLGILADLISANRKLIQEVLFYTRSQMYSKDDSSAVKR